MAGPDNCGECRCTVSAQTVDGVGKTLAGVAFLTVEIDSAFDNVKNLFLGCEKS